MRKAKQTCGPMADVNHHREVAAAFWSRDAALRSDAYQLRWIVAMFRGSWPKSTGILMRHK